MESCGKIGQDKEYEVSIVNWEKVSKQDLFIQIALCVS